MLRQAEEFSDSDRNRRQRIEKRNRSQDLISQCDRQLRETALDFGPQFAAALRRRIENLMRDLQDSVDQDDDRQIDLDYANLQDALYDLNREVNLASQDYWDEEDDFFDLPSMASIKEAGSKLVSKGVEAVRGESTVTRRTTTTRRYDNNNAWEDWDDDDW